MNRIETVIERRRLFGLLELNSPKNINCIQITGESFRHNLMKYVVGKLIGEGLRLDEIQELLNINLVLVLAEMQIKSKPIYKHAWQRPQFISEARFSNRLVADIFIIQGEDMGTVVEIAESETEKSLKIKERAYMNMGLKFEVIRV